MFTNELLKLDINKEGQYLLPHIHITHIQTAYEDILISSGSFGWVTVQQDSCCAEGMHYGSFDHTWAQPSLYLFFNLQPLIEEMQQMNSDTCWPPPTSTTSQGQPHPLKWSIICSPLPKFHASDVTHLNRPFWLSSMEQRYRFTPHHACLQRSSSGTPASSSSHKAHSWV